ncbi:diaminopimelate decarboxylase [Leptospira ilyithenensis]|uniref:Diaminopimelate decarboxylase n=1 Tax=Leptospira ilyithenensis TaxID=2484901 RepID=A0A4R9LSY1_9LEPT|nr:diaminopimelate decarboxylase [Leptospira ilyithenensis]TGN12012.1 diaminopimelate decarboxylase [Leptospira ilyithenensis]
MTSIEKLKFLNEDQVRSIAGEFGTPVFVYSQAEIEKKCDEALSFPNAFGLNVRYAMKASPNANVLKIMQNKGILIDASSEHEVHRAVAAGFPSSAIMITSQQFPKDLKSFIEKGVEFNACSLQQLEEFGKLFPGHTVSIRFNPGLGSGHTKKTDVGGVTSSFGIWHEKMPELKAIVSKYNLVVNKVHTHIGSGSDPEVWKAVAHYTLEYAEMFESVTTVSLGGGYKVGRMADEKSTDLQLIGKPAKELFVQFAEKHGRKLTLEIEPGTYLVALCASLITTVDDKIDTGSKGYCFLKLDTGMDANTRPSLYGAKHPLVTVPGDGRAVTKTEEYVVVGHCCESGDVFTQKEGGEPIARLMAETNVGDLVSMEAVGAYCSSMSTKNYNSFPETPEVLVLNSGETKLIRKKQVLEDIYKNEIKVL